MDIKMIKNTYKAYQPTPYRLPILLGTLALNSLLMSACSESSNYAESISENSADMESVQFEYDANTDSQTMNIKPDASEPSEPLNVNSLSGNSEQTLNSQAADIQIVGKDLLITASADFKVADVVKSRHAIEDMTRQQGGYVAQSDISNNPQGSRTFIQGDKNITLMTYYRQASMTVRIPRENVNPFLSQVQQQVAFLNAQSFSAKDVTLDIYREQLSARLNRDMATELGQERLNSNNAKEQNSNVDSITATYAARQQQEYAKLQQMDIADKVKYSTIDLIFTQPDISYKEITQNLDILIEAERPSFIVEVTEAFKQGWETLKIATITLIQLWWLLILGGAFYVLYRIIKAIYANLFKRNRRLNRSKSQNVLPKKDDSIS